MLVISLLVLITSENRSSYCYSSSAMNVLNQLDPKSSSDSNGSPMEDIVTIEDGDHSEHESDGVTDQGISIESDSTHSGNSSVSLLSVLTAPDMSELSRK